MLVPHQQLESRMSTMLINIQQNNLKTFCPSRCYSDIIFVIVTAGKSWRT